MKSSDLKTAWLTECNSAPASPSAASIGTPVARPITPIPIESTMMPMFSMLEYASDRFRSAVPSMFAAPSTAENAPSATSVQPQATGTRCTISSTRRRP